MAKDLKRVGPRQLATTTEERTDGGAGLTISPLTALFLNMVWGVGRLTKRVDAQTGLVESLHRFGAAHIRLTELPQEMAAEAKEREERTAALSHQIARTGIETELLDSEKRRRQEENETAIKRLQAEGREHDQKGQPVEQRKEPRREHKDNTDAALDRGVAAADRHLKITRVITKMHREVDESVAAGEFTKEEGERIKEEMEELIRKSIHSE